ncbi:hypothetical protein Pro02_53850 [Planobispora rosea]|uniref:Uncharacterized protein n=1 Tax=Planobispora rosea TaxID=35762 RepID=A0A8J3S3A9_PLARO|nr:hypothetical protein Pro02_53850 [Planobispora rosea]
MRTGPSDRTCQARWLSSPGATRGEVVTTISGMVRGYREAVRRPGGPEPGSYCDAPGSAPKRLLSTRPPPWGLGSP